jgi:hypothetical protein
LSRSEPSKSARLSKWEVWDSSGSSLIARKVVEKVV